MATADSVKAKLEGLISKANEATGNSDADLTTAVDSLIEGYGQGGEDTLGMLLNDTLTSYSNEEVTEIGAYRFYKSTALTSVNLPSVTKLGESAFKECTSIPSVSFPKVTQTGARVFDECTSLKSVSCPLLTQLQGYICAYCTALEEVSFPSLTSLASNNSYFFSGDIALLKADLGLLNKIDQNIFYNCSSLSTVILRKADSICTLSSTYQISYGQFAEGGTGGKVYVPEALIETYQTATNWSTLYAAGNCEFVALEGSEYE